MARIYNLACLVIIAVFSIITAENYCNLQSCKEKHSIHTLCKYPSSTPAAACGRSYSSGLHNTEKQKIVNIHNQLRQKVAKGQEPRGLPGPQYAAIFGTMPNLTWDNELENIAQRWANQCNFGHDQCRDVEKFQVGQNIAETYFLEENLSTLKSMVQLWEDEVAKYDRENVTSYQYDSQTGHYTQMVWAKTLTIGCGFMKYKKANKWNTKYLVCNYGPSGNLIGKEVYKAKKN